MVILAPNTMRSSVGGATAPRAPRRAVSRLRRAGPRWLPRITGRNQRRDRNVSWSSTNPAVNMFFRQRNFLQRTRALIAVIGFRLVWLKT
jgi:hypothetical protein